MKYDYQYEYEYEYDYHAVNLELYIIFWSTLARYYNILLILLLDPFLLVR